MSKSDISTKEVESVTRWAMGARPTSQGRARGGRRGVRTMDLARVPVQYAFTLDSCELGEVVEATFNAATATINIEGVSAHPMEPKRNMLNPILLAHGIIAEFDREETPGCTGP